MRQQAVEMDEHAAFLLERKEEEIVKLTRLEHEEAMRPKWKAPGKKRARAEK